MRIPAGTPSPCDGEAGATHFVWTVGYLVSSRYEVIGELGNGASGLVFEAVDHDTGQHVAIKTLREQGPSAVAQITAEYQALHHVRHPNLVSPGELILDGDRCLFTMELVDGIDLLSWVHGIDERPNRPAAPFEPTRPLGFLAATEIGSAGVGEGPTMSIRTRGHGELHLDRLRDALAQLVRGLSVLHAGGKVHRDVKPDNILVTRSRRLVLLDFGLVADARESRVDDDLAGTLGYIAPEQALGEFVAASDWYSVGVILYQSLAGRLPFRGAPYVILHAKLCMPVPEAPLANAPPELAGLALRLLDRDPAQRPHASEILRALE